MCLTLLLSACGNSQQAFFNINNRGQSLTLLRDQAYWRGPWQTALIVAGLPQCQRRYPMDGLGVNTFRLDVYRPESGVFILNAGKRWYVTELQQCGFQTYQDPPPEPGEMIGSFRVKNDVLQYVSQSLPKAEAEVESVTPPVTQ
ncbi:MAG TPA: hypothetical protein VIM43_04535 [Rugosibacter sp.]